MFIERRVRYLDYCRNDEKICGAGFITLEVYSDSVKMSIRVKCRSIQNAVIGKVLLECQNASGSKLIGEMEVVDGEGGYERIFRNSGKGEEEYQQYVNADRLRIDWGDEVMLVSALKELQITKNVRENQTSSEHLVLNKQKKHTEVLSKPLDSKWEHLQSVYPHIKPFQDKREYLEIRPVDFLVLDEESYQSANNSFLMHGFYNYKHLILAQINRNQEKVYYVGAPGNYYEREKQVAIMFGFESFECAEEPAQQGDFGYYMLRVKI